MIFIAPATYRATIGTGTDNGGCPDWIKVRNPAVRREAKKIGEAAMKAKQTGVNWEIAVDGKPRSYRVDKQFALDSAQ